MKTFLLFFIILTLPKLFAQNCSSERLLVHAHCESPSKILNLNKQRELEFVKHVGIYSLQKQEQVSNGSILCTYAPIYSRTTAHKIVNWRSTYISKGTTVDNLYDLETLGQLFRGADDVNQSNQEIYPTYEPFLQVIYAPHGEKGWDYILQTFFNGLEYLEKKSTYTNSSFTGIRKNFRTPDSDLSNFYVTGVNCELDISRTNFESIADVN